MTQASLPEPDLVHTDSPDEPTPPRRIPHLGHALLFLAIAGLCLLLTQGILFALHPPAHGLRPTILNINPKLLLGSQMLSYGITLLACAALFPHLWRRSFLSGIEWRWNTARHQALRLIPLGFALAIAAQGSLYYFTPPKNLPIEQIFSSASTAWLATVFGILIAPTFEEICFRGFLLPAFAVAYDWIALPRTPQALVRWQSSTTLTPAALLFSAILSSLLFILLHGQQLDFLIPTLLVLFCVSLVLTFVRIRTGSVAASTLVHGAYNGFVFVAAIIQTHGYRHLDKLSR